MVPFAVMPAPAFAGVNSGGHPSFGEMDPRFRGGDTVVGLPLAAGTTWARSMHLKSAAAAALFSPAGRYARDPRFPLRVLRIACAKLRCGIADCPLRCDLGIPQDSLEPTLLPVVSDRVGRNGPRGGSMSKEENYRKNAAETVDLAVRATSTKDKSRLLALAEAWRTGRRDRRGGRFRSRATAYSGQDPQRSSRKHEERGAGRRSTAARPSCVSRPSDACRSRERRPHRGR
jgi:hypothetical protein